MNPVAGKSISRPLTALDGVLHAQVTGRTPLTPRERYYVGSTTLSDPKPIKPTFNNIENHLITILIISLSIIHQSCYCAEWPQFHGLHRNGQSPEDSLMPHWPASGPPLRWTKEGLGDGFSAAVVANKLIYVSGMNNKSGDGFVTALNLDGETRWKSVYGREWQGNHPGTRYPPTLDNGQLFLLSGYGVLHALDAATGNSLWKRDVFAEFEGISPAMGYAESILVDGDFVFCTPGGKDASLVALDRHTGETKWTSKGHSDEPAYCAPQLVERGGTRLLITLTNASLIALAPDSGAILWRVPFDETETLQNHSNAPVYHDGLLYVTSGHREGGKLFELAPCNGKSAGWGGAPSFTPTTDSIATERRANLPCWRPIRPPTSNMER